MGKTRRTRRNLAVRRTCFREHFKKQSGRLNGRSHASVEVGDPTEARPCCRLLHRFSGQAWPRMI